MTGTSRRGFFKTFLAAGAALTFSGIGAGDCRAGATTTASIKGVCLYVPTLGKAGEFIELMNKNASGDWQVEALEGSLDERYFRTRDIYKRSCGHANTLVGVVDPASFTIIHAAVIDSGGSFYYVTYEERGRVTFSVRL